MVGFEELTITPLVQLGVAGMWIIYMVWKEKSFQETIKRSLDNNTQVIEKLIIALEADDGNK